MIDPITEPIIEPGSEPAGIDSVQAIQHLVTQVEKVIRGKRKQIENGDHLPAGRRAHTDGR